MTQKHNLQDRKILLTGATGVLGRALARALALQGADLILLARRKANLEELDDAIAADGGRAPTLVEFDFQRAQDIQYQELAGALAQDLAREGLDAMILAAGLHTGLHPIEHLSVKDWRKILDVNLNAPFLLIQQIMPLLKQAQGQLLGVSAPLENKDQAFWGAYGVSKSALDTLLNICREETEGVVKVSHFEPQPMASPIRAAVYPGETRDGLPPVKNNVDLIVAMLEQHGMT
ncbi:MAG: SDR family NAD(P)-dependent oxidoreductase [Oceanococcus sp.]